MADRCTSSAGTRRRVTRARAPCATSRASTLRPAAGRACRRRRSRGPLPAQRCSGTACTSPAAAATRSPRSPPPRSSTSTAERWSLGPPLRHAREHVAAVAAGGAVWLLGGRALGQGNFADVERLRPGAAAWQVMPPMPLARSSFQAVAVAGMVVVVGGEGPGGTFAEVDAMDPASGSLDAAPRSPAPAARARSGRIGRSRVRDRRRPAGRADDLERGRPAAGALRSRSLQYALAMRPRAAPDLGAFAIGFDQRDRARLHALWDRVIDAQRWSQGPLTDEFEAAWAAWNGLPSVAMGSWSGAARGSARVRGRAGRDRALPLQHLHGDAARRARRRCRGRVRRLQPRRPLRVVRRLRGARRSRIARARRSSSTSAATSRSTSSASPRSAAPRASS